MAILVSEDRDTVSSFQLESGELRTVQDQLWRRFKLRLASGDHKLELGNASADEELDACMFCLQPNNEVASFIEHLTDLAERKRDRVLFEPAEPSFELEIVRSGFAGIKVHVWLDAGNAKTGIYRWDAAGVRFYTIQEHLLTFLETLRAEFAN